MRLNEFSTVNPVTPQQQRVKSLQAQKDNASKALKAERDRQKVTKAQQQIRDVKVGN